MLSLLQSLLWNLEWLQTLAVVAALLYMLRTISYGMRDTMNGRAVDGKGGKEFVEGEPFRSQEELYKAYK